MATTVSVPTVRTDVKNPTIHSLIFNENNANTSTDIRTKAENERKNIQVSPYTSIISVLLITCSSNLEIRL
jgi:hypothetical protein